LLVRYDNTTVPPRSNFDRYNTFSLFLADNDHHTSVLNFGLRSSADRNTFMARQGTGDPPGGAYVEQPFLAGVTHLMVAKLTYSHGRFGRVDGWLDPVYLSQGTPTISLSEGKLDSISHVFLRVARSDPDDRFSFAHLVLGTAWDDVVPSAHSP
jgi:hypothetical protein